MTNQTLAPVASIQATKVEGQGRLDFFLKHFGKQYFCTAESLLYGHMTKLCEAYNGGLWEFFTLSNGGIYMSPKGYDEGMEIAVEGNGFDDKFTQDAAGITATLFMMGQLLWMNQEDEAMVESVTNLYYKLRDFAKEHAEAELILSAID